MTRITDWFTSGAEFTTMLNAAEQSGPHSERGWALIRHLREKYARFGTRTRLSEGDYLHLKRLAKMD